MSLKIVKKLKPCEFKWDEDKVNSDYKIHFGFIAQDVEKIFPKNEYGIVVDKQRGYLGIQYLEFIPLMVKAIQELEEKVKMLEEKNGNII